MPRRIVLAITGATGAVYGWRLLQVLAADPALETHLVITPAGAATIRQELRMEPAELKALATVSHGYREIGAPIASGSFATDGMVIAPCSMNTLAAVAHGLSANLVTRAADVTLKERRRLVLLARETPLTLVHLRNMTAVTEMGGLVAPPAPAFYNDPASIAEMVDHTVGRTLDLLNLAELAGGLVTPWEGLEQR
ncbi:MAG: 3-octaprenyl-4-hydroxybenzoate carboxy-lyase [Porticoccaceae bacterium]|jgi:4-hydroxy-3-polyprenylbenzoate decarboxylase|nr:3-octaprenyl-4-hydroxybenzoate carboxy-lyase [Porticoccaceae bacterium]